MSFIFFPLHPCLFAPSPIPYHSVSLPFSPTQGCDVAQIKWTKTIPGGHSTNRQACAFIPPTDEETGTKRPSELSCVTQLGNHDTRFQRGGNGLQSELLTLHSILSTKNSTD
jgi:hypothetical protein